MEKCFICKKEIKKDQRKTKHNDEWYHDDCLFLALTKTKGTK